MTLTMKFDYYTLFLFTVGFTSLVCLFGIVDGFVPTMMVIVNTLAWGLFGKALKVE